MLTSSFQAKIRTVENIHLPVGLTASKYLDISDEISRWYKM